MATQRGTFHTQQASRYIKQLCTHFAHKIEVSYDDTSGHASLPPGPAKMAAKPDQLRIEITADAAEGLGTARHIIDSHLKNFAFREGFETMDWAEPDGL